MKLALWSLPKPTCLHQTAPSPARGYARPTRPEHTFLHHAASHTIHTPD